MTNVIFRFDTEDYVNEHALDGIMNAIEPLNNAGFKGCFVVVGRFAEALMKWGRQDIIDALKKHEIGIHSLAHSQHPTINEYTDIDDFDEALRIFLENEQECIDILQDVFDVGEMSSSCGPGNSISYVAHYGYADLKAPVYLGGFVADWNRSRPLEYANVICIPTTYCLDKIYDISKKEIDELLEDIATNKENCVFCHHPAMNMVNEFYDALNYKGENTPEDKWKLSTLLSEEDRIKWCENYSYLVNKIKDDPRFNVITGKEIKENCFIEKRIINRETLKEIKPLIDEELFPVTVPDSYSLTDIMYACRDILLGKEEHECGYVYGFLYKPYAISEKVTVTAEDIKKSASQIGNKFLPVKVKVGEVEIGPADWMRAALEILTTGAESVTIEPAPWQVDLEQFPHIKDASFKGTWMHSKDFEDKYITDRLRLQLWTVRLPKGTYRKIF